MTMIARDLIDRLIASGVGTAFGTDLFVNYRPETPDVVVVLHEYGGEQPVNVMSTGLPPVVKPRIQLEVRGVPEDVPGAYQLAVAAYTSLCLVMDLTIGTHRMTLIPLGTPILSSRDDQLRPTFTCNFETYSNL